MNITNFNIEKLIPTSEKVTIENYPWGFRLKTTMFDSMEFDQKKGYRTINQTIDPKTNRICKPKKSTYCSFIIRYYDEIGHIKNIRADFYYLEKVNDTLKFFSSIYNLLAPEEIEYLYIKFLSYCKITMISQVTYCGAKLEELKPLFNEQIQIALKGMKEKTNLFEQLYLDIDSIEGKKVEGFNPFRKTTYSMTENGLQKISEEPSDHDKRELEEQGN